MNITLPSLRCLEPKVTIPKLCGGDLYRASAPVLSDDEKKRAASQYARSLKNVTAAQKVYDPRKWAMWTDEVIVVMHMLRRCGYRSSQIAEQLNQLFPQTIDVKFTKNSVLGKLKRIRDKKK